VKDWTIVIPVRGTSGSKSRLGASRELASAIALDTVAASVAAGVGPVIVVTSAEAAPEFEALGARSVFDEGAGLSAAIHTGILAAGPHRVAVLLGDLPALLSGELAEALELAEHHPLAMVPDADAVGTTLVTAIDSADHRPAFGAASRAAHLNAGYVELEIPAASGLRRDVDTAEQLASLDGRLGPRTSALRAET
jgi:2-phospho-L-lactate guanylyltransferase